jgi:hypothetical protein
MSELSQLLIDAWNEISPKLRNDPDELARRLARCRTPTLTRSLQRRGIEAVSDNRR